MSLHEIDTVRILIEVVEKDIPLVHIGQKAEVRAEADRLMARWEELTTELEALGG